MGEEEKGHEMMRSGSVLYAVRREIGKAMPTGGIRFTASIRVIMTIKLENNSLNEMSKQFGVTFVLNAN